MTRGWLKRLRSEWRPICWLRQRWASTTNGGTNWQGGASGPIGRRALCTTPGSGGRTAPQREPEGSWCRRGGSGAPSSVRWSSTQAPSGAARAALAEPSTRSRSGCLLFSRIWKERSAPATSRALGATRSACTDRTKCGPSCKHAPGTAVGAIIPSGTDFKQSSGTDFKQSWIIPDYLHDFASGPAAETHWNLVCYIVTNVFLDYSQLFPGLFITIPSDFNHSELFGICPCDVCNEAGVRPKASPLRRRAASRSAAPAATAPPPGNRHATDNTATAQPSHPSSYCAAAA